MKIDTHVLFLIIIIGIISAGIVGATVMNNDTSMKQEVFDGITVSVPADSEFVKTGDGVYKDSNYGIKINTFKNNESMIDFLKNTKKSKIIPVDDQPPQSVAFKKGDNINILVTDGQEGISIGTKDGELTSKMANSIIFSNNHKSEKPAGLSLSQPRMNVDQDFNLIMLLVADVDTKTFNLNLLEENLVVFVDDYNEDLEEPVSDDTNVDEDSEEYMDVEDSDDLDNILTDSNDTDDSSDDSEPVTTDLASDSDDSSDDDVAQASPADVSSDDEVIAASGAPDSSSGDSASSDTQEPLSLSECEDIVEDDMELNLGPDYSIDHNEEVDGFYVFFISDMDNNIIGNYTVDPNYGTFQFYQMI